MDEPVPQLAVTQWRDAGIDDDAVLQRGAPLSLRGRLLGVAFAFGKAVPSHHAVRFDAVPFHPAARRRDDPGGDETQPTPVAVGIGRP